MEKKRKGKSSPWINSWNVCDSDLFFLTELIERMCAHTRTQTERDRERANVQYTGVSNNKSTASTKFNKNQHNRDTDYSLENRLCIKRTHAHGVVRKQSVHRDSLTTTGSNSTILHNTIQ